MPRRHQDTKELKGKSRNATKALRHEGLKRKAEMPRRHEDTKEINGKSGNATKGRRHEGIKGEEQ